MIGKNLLVALVTLTTIVMFGTMISYAFADTYYYVRQDAPDNIGVPNGDPSNPDDCWRTISQTFTDLKSNVGGTLVGKGKFIIQVQDTATYSESVALEGLATTSVDTLTLRSLNGRPTIDATNQSGEAMKITTVAYVTVEGFELKTDQGGADGVGYRVLWHNQTGLNQGLLTVRNNVFDGQGAGNEPAYQCAQLQVMPMLIDCIISGNDFKNCYDDDDSCPLLSVYTDTTGGEPVSEPEVIISDNVFHDNIVNAVIYNSDDYQHRGIIERNRIYHNRCPSTSTKSFGGIITFHFRQNGLMVVRNNFIYNNDWSYLPGRAAIYCTDSDNKKIYNNTLYHNNASGGEIYVASTSDVGVEVKNNIICPTPNKKYCIYLEAGAEAGFTSATNLFYADFDNDGTYDIRYSISPITQANWEVATQCDNEPWPSLAGTSESFAVTGLSSGITYYFALKTADEVPHWSELSNISIGTTEEGAVQAMHVSDITMSLKTKGSNVNAIATVTIVDVLGASISEATVSGHWSGATSDIDSGITDASGQISLNSDKVKNPAGGTTFTFTVDNVEKADWTYDESANVETSDSTVPLATPAVGAYTTNLGNAFPSPANPETWIPFTLSKAEHVVLKIYNVNGQLVRTLNLEGV